MVLPWLNSFNNLCKSFKPIGLTSMIRSKADSAVNKECIHPYPCGEFPAAVVLGLYKRRGGGNIKFTKTAMAMNDALSGRLLTSLRRSRPMPDLGEARVFHGLHPVYSPITFVGLGEECKGYSVREQMDERKEAIRVATATGVRACQEFDIDRILVDSCDHAESAAEGASMGAWMYQEFRDIRVRHKSPKVELFDSCDFTGWQIGLHKAAAQNLARHLQEAPSNHLSPQSFAQSVIELLSKYCINVEVRMRHWAKLRNLNAFLAAGKGGCDPIFLEIFYEGCNPDICPIVLIGKGVTFNTGGLCMRTCKDMRHMRGDMLGAACIVATMRAIAALQIPVNVRGLIPLCANVAGAKAIKPGDTIKAHNGRTIRVDCTQCEGLLMHADALSYAGEYNPKFILDLGTLTEDTFGAMGQASSLVFSNNENLFEMMRIASIHTGDKIWRFPLWYHFNHNVRSSTSDFKNDTPLYAGGGPCKAAAFLRNFVPPGIDWIHLDVQNIFRTNGRDFPYLRSGMSGRPTRNIIEFLAQMACNHQPKPVK